MKIETVTGDVNASSKSGKTTINNCNGKNITIKSKNGNIKVENVNSNLTINTTSGLTNVKFKENLDNNIEFNFSAKNGSLNANNIACPVKISIADGGVCKLNLNFTKILKNNIIEAKRGAVSIVAPIQKCKLTITSNVKTDIVYADIESTENLDNVKVAGATDNCENILNISSTKGKIKIRAN